jgi:hypothetical protein
LSCPRCWRNSICTEPWSWATPCRPNGTLVYRLWRRAAITCGSGALGAKENQPTLLAELTELFTPPPITPGHAAPARDFQTVRRLDKGHGRLEERVLTASSMLAGYSDWPALAQVFKLERRVWQQGVQTLHEVRYGITSLPQEVADAPRLLQIARAEWGIENGLHYRRDVTLQEDASQLRRGQGPQVMAALNNVVVSLLGQAGEVNLAALQRTFAYQFDRFLAQLHSTAPT